MLGRIEGPCTLKVAQEMQLSVLTSKKKEEGERNGGGNLGL